MLWGGGVVLLVRSNKEKVNINVTYPQFTLAKLHI